MNIFYILICLCLCLVIGFIACLGLQKVSLTIEKAEHYQRIAVARFNEVGLMIKAVVAADRAFSELEVKRLIEIETEAKKLYREAMVEISKRTDTLLLLQSLATIAEVVTR